MSATMTAELEIVEGGLLTTLQDLGRTRSEILGIAVNGAADRYAAESANLLVGNPVRAVHIEATGAGTTFTSSANILIAVTGADADLTINGVPSPLWTPTLVPAGALVRVSPPRSGLRTSVAVHGRIDSRLFLGSAAPDKWFGFGQHLESGTRLMLSGCQAGFSQHARDGMPFVLPPQNHRGLGARVMALDAVEAPDLSLVPEAHELLAESEYVVGPQLDSVGMRLSGPVVHPATHTEIVSHGVPAGAIEIPPSDELIVLGRGRSLTAGYPVIGVVTSASLSLAGQAAPGTRVRFRWRSLNDARSDYLAQREELRQLRASVERLFTATGLPCCWDEVP